MNDQNQLPPIVDLDPKKLRSRQTQSEMRKSSVDKIRKNIRKKGFDSDQPIEAFDVNGTYIIRDGHHRAEAAIKEKLPSVPVRIYEVTAEEADQYRQEAIEAEEYKGF